MWNSLSEEGLAIGISKYNWTTLSGTNMHVRWEEGGEAWFHCMWNNNPVKCEIIFGPIVVGLHRNMFVESVFWSWVFWVGAHANIGLFGLAMCCCWTTLPAWPASVYNTCCNGEGSLLQLNIWADTMGHWVTVLWIFPVLLLQINSPASVLIARFRSSASLHTLFWTLSNKLMSFTEEGE